MRTKITILSAVALAAGILSSNAQVYSANVVGYYNVTLPPLRQVLITDQLPGGNGTNTMFNNELLGFSDLEPVTGYFLLVYNGTGLDVFTYFPPSAGGPAWVDQGGNVTTASLGLGKSAYLQNANTTAKTITIVGQVFQGPFTNTLLPFAQSFRALPMPVGTNVDSTIGNMNTASSDGDFLFKWNPLSHTVGFYDQSFTFFGPANGGPAWVDQGGNIATPQFAVGEGFLYQRLTAGTANWVTTFTVQ
jgi:hypothetical protein